MIDLDLAQKRLLRLAAEQQPRQIPLLHVTSVKLV